MTSLLKLKFIKTGLLTLVVDNSRMGYQKFGVPVGGAMDVDSANKANELVGNETQSSLLEINMMGPKIQFKNNCQIAITGANISPIINNEPIKMYETLSISKGTILQFGNLVNGTRAYLAIRGKWKVKDWMDEESPRVVSSINSLNSIKITPFGNFVPVRESDKIDFEHSNVVIKVIKGPEFDWLDNKVKSVLLKTTFYLLPASNRMGYRLSPNLPTIGKSIISSGVVPGTLQITEDGYPILLMQDAPATGGYTRVLNVISNDMPKLGQLKAGDSLRFEFVNQPII